MDCSGDFDNAGEIGVCRRAPESLCIQAHGASSPVTALRTAFVDICDRFRTFLSNAISRFCAEWTIIDDNLTTLPTDLKISLVFDHR
jgi:hypothetical protein